MPEHHTGFKLRQCYMKSKHQLYHPHEARIKIDGRLRLCPAALFRGCARSQFPLHVEPFVCGRTLFLP